ncbi:hypothetical protein Pryu01_00571 [Paraliobacillus ryukyuensis]|uniref:YqzL-like protein n=1 Tax=Paraliobacillus ryukyuensis TaxID=200904 RepID=A0A366EGA9_9BACI|nr:YqzL family protein [Paraliobacillus ryukyuensis]RBP01363.1 YqzL-like protein [Paraliobacillus ryukyuensis]
MIDLPWKLFSQTGNIETYLLMKELEADTNDGLEAYVEDDIEEYDHNF